jgi:hypothetical protein
MLRHRELAGRHRRRLTKHLTITALEHERTRRAVDTRPRARVEIRPLTRYAALIPCMTKASELAGRR